MFTIKLSAQNLDLSVLSSSGNYFSKSNGSLSWNLGELKTETLQSPDYIITQGFEQSGYKVTTVDNNSGTGVGIIIYPNPVQKYLHIEFPAGKYTYLFAEVYSISGEKLQYGNIDLKNNTLELKNYSTNLLLLRLYDIKGNHVQSFQLLKINQ